MESKYHFAIDFSRFLAFGHWALGFGGSTLRSVVNRHLP